MSVIFSLLLLSQGLSIINVSLISPFFPPVAEARGLTSDYIGLILCCNPIGAVSTSILFGKLIN